ncbi:hypothetical protein CEXT_501431 [Caerostris extrusa]|uniref:Uncharacterized protein n=1 Tax=Caerostris extrusa TaxID=172846 RepID=A0AAV4RKI3_CAEEX|nr:hypothetical protein CEXT_501431 [Caerostris extrusa]
MMNSCSDIRIIGTRFVPDSSFIVGSLAMNGCNRAVRDKEWEEISGSIKRNSVLQTPATDSNGASGVGNLLLKNSVF